MKPWQFMALSSLIVIAPNFTITTSMIVGGMYLFFTLLFYYKDN